MKQKAKKDLRKRSIAVFAALAVCLTMAQAPAFTLSAYANEIPAQGENIQSENGQPAEKTEEEKKETSGEEKSDEKKQDETPADPEKTDPDGKTPDPDKPETEEKDPSAEGSEGENNGAGDDENAELPKNFGDECLEAIGSAEDTESVLQAIEDCLSRYGALSDEEKAEFAEVYANLLAYKAEVTGETEGEAVNPLETVEEEIAPQADSVATIGEDGYATLQEAITAAGSMEEATIVLTTDVTENIVIAGGNLTLDLGEFTIYGDGTASVVTINGGNVTINGGTITGGKAGTKNGGGICITNATLSLNDVEIVGNIAYCGGGIYVGTGAEVTMTDGSVSNNDANSSSRRTGGNGGGVYITGGGSFSIEGTTIDGNEAGYHASDSFEAPRAGAGGGVYVGWNSYFTMNNGCIRNNSAYAWSGTCGGGGIYIDTGNISEGRDIIAFYNNVELISGEITGNTSYSVGGGIYVNSYSYLELARTAVVNNDNETLKQQGSIGGGIYFCGIGTGEFYSTSGCLITDNQATERASDFIAADADYYRGRIGTIHLSTRLHNGTKVDWYEDGLPKKHGVPFVSVEESPVIDDLEAWIAAKEEKEWELPLHSETEGKVDGYYRLVISENHADQGGGIANNGLLIMGEDKDVKLTINKVWDVEEGTELPESITVKVFRNEKELEEVVLNKENDWKTTLIDLPGDGEYTVEEVAVEGYEVSYGELVKNGSEWSIEITNKPAAPKGSLIINKNLAENAPEEARNKEYTFTVTGPNYNETVAIPADGQKILENLEPGDYTVTEQNADITGYKWTVSVNGNSGSTITVPVEGGADAAEVTFTNSYERPTTPPTEPEEPNEPDEPETPPYNPPPRRPTPPEEEVPEEEPPLAETPEVEVPEEEVPLAELPPEEEIPEEEVPLADIPKTGDTDGSLWAALLALSMAGAALIARKLRSEKNS